MHEPDALPDALGVELLLGVADSEGDSDWLTVCDFVPDDVVEGLEVLEGVPVADTVIVCEPEED